MSGRRLLPGNRFWVERDWRDLGAAAAHKWKVFLPGIRCRVSGAGARWALPPLMGGRFRFRVIGCVVSGAGAPRVQPPLVCRRRCLQGIRLVKVGLAHVGRSRRA